MEVVRVASDLLLFSLLTRETLGRRKGEEIHTNLLERWRVSEREREVNTQGTDYGQNFCRNEL